MNTNIILKRGLAAGMAFVFLSACSDSFLQDMKDYNKYGDEVFDNVQTATAKLDYIYYLGLRTFKTTDFSLETEEQAVGTSTSAYFTQVSELTINNVPDYFYGSNSTYWLYIRECNMFLYKLERGSLSEAEKAPLRGQAHFWRAWFYFDLVKYYGGVPIILEPQNPIMGDSGEDQSELQTPRSSTGDCIKQVCADLDEAIKNLTGKWEDANWGRVNAGAAAALKGRVLLTYASPMFNRDDEASRWQDAYNANVAAKKLLEDNGFGLEDGGGNRAKNWEQMFVNVKSKEAVLTRLYTTTTLDNNHNNGWEQSARPKDANGGGGISATAEMLDLFPMADGKKAVRGENYDTLLFYKNRDPRFYRTFAFNGVKWPYSGGDKYTVWNYQWYKDQAAVNSGKEGSGFAEYLGHIASGVYVRKRTDPAAKYDATDQFKKSAVPTMEIRFAEVVLNLAEAAVGCNKLEEGYQGLRDIRKRVGIPAGGDGNYGVSSGLTRDGLFREILFERQIEFAYEGKRFYDMRRWMLYNDDSSEKNNTCQRLAIEPFNGKRHHGVYLAVKPEVYAASSQGKDYDIFNPESSRYDNAKVTRNGISLDPDASDADFNAQIALLDNFYKTNLTREVNDLLDPTGPRYEVSYRSKYYFLGFKEGVMKQSSYLLQTKGWDDYFKNAGTFDPLQ